MKFYARIGRAYIEVLIAGLEESRPGWLPMFYSTGSFEGDINAATQLRKQCDLPRPDAIQKRIDIDSANFARFQSEAMAKQSEAMAKANQHKKLMKTSWIYWLREKLKLNKSEAEL